MPRHVPIAIGSSLALALATLAVGTAAADPVDPVHTVSVTGTGISTWPAYGEDVARFAIDTTNASTGAVTVEASTDDPDGTITVNGVPLTTASTEVSGLEVGDEVNVQITDSDGTSNQSWIYLPASYPKLTTTSSGAGPSDGYVFLGLISFLSTPKETVVDAYGVPVHVRDAQGQDLKPSGDGYVVARRTDCGTASCPTEIVELDDQFRPTAHHQLDGMPESTDNHDFEILDDGSALLMGYDLAERPDESTWLDAVIQIVDPDGQQTFEWNSKDHIDPADAYVSPPTFGDGYFDYAHINSLQVVGDERDVLASFRNLSQVRLIATQAHDGYAAGDTIWTFGGADNDFTITDADAHPDGGPCAQHQARIMPGNGHLMLFDNGSRNDGAGSLGGQTADMCANAFDPDGPRIARPLSRVTEYALDLSNPSEPAAQLVWQYSYPNRYAAFAGGQQRLANGNTLINWSQSTDASGAGAPQPIATEVTSAGDQVWSVSAPGWFSYRATKADAPDRIAPEVMLSGPTEGAVYDEGETPEVVYSCTDRGGSNLATCEGTVPAGTPAPSTPGKHTVSVTSTDVAGNENVVEIGYRVTGEDPPPTSDPSPSTSPGPSTAPSPSPSVGPPLAPAPVRGVEADLRLGSRPWVDAATARIGAGDTARLVLRLTNTGSDPDRLRLRAGTSGAPFRVRYVVGGRSVTARFNGAGWVTPQIAPGTTVRVDVEASRGKARTGARRTIRLIAASLGDTAIRDRVTVRLHAVR